MVTRDTSNTGGAERKAREAMGRAEHEADRMQREAVDSGRQMMGSARDRIRSLFEHQSHRAADQLGGVAHALHQAAQQLDDENQGPAARYVDTAAERVEQMADTLRDSSVDDLVGMVEGYARRQPEVFLGAAFAAGFLFSRFIKSSGERRYGAMGPARPAAAYSPPRRDSYPAGYGTYAPPAPRGPDAADLMAGGSPEPIRPKPAHVPDETLGPTPAVGAGTHATKPGEIKP